MTPPAVMAPERTDAAASDVVVSSAHARVAAPTAPPQFQRSAPPRLRVVGPSKPHRLPLVIGIIAVAVLTIMFGFAVFHSQMATNQYELEEIQRELVLENERIADLELQLDQLNSPAFIERMARGAIGMVDPEAPVDIVVDDELLLDVASRESGSTTVGSQ